MKKSVVLIFTLFFCFNYLFAQENNYLEQAKKVANWLTLISKQDGDKMGIIDEIGKDEISLGLSSGMAGKVVFYLELYSTLL